MTISVGKRISLLNISIDNLTKDELLEKLSHGGIVVTPNVDHMMKLQWDPEFHQVYRHADYVVCDSQILLLASKLLKQPLREKISGSDLFPAFYNYYRHDTSVKIFLLGGLPGVAAEAQARINAKVGREIVVGSYSPPFGFENDAQENERILDLITASQATVLAVGVGAPKQEKWIYKHQHQLPGIKTFLAIGATLNFEAGYTPRSPQWMSQTGLEWLHRLLSEPKRLWKRYLVDDLPFGWLLLQQLLNRYYYQLPLGQVLQEAELLNAKQVAEIITLQQLHPFPPRRFGEWVIEQGWLRPKTIEFFAEQLPQLRRSHTLLSLEDYLKATALLSEEQLAVIAADHRQSGQDWGEIAVQRGWIPQGTVNLWVNYLTTKEGIIMPKASSQQWATTAPQQAI